MTRLKDERLHELAERGLNVARFFSVGPDGRVRYVVFDAAASPDGSDIETLASRLFALGAPSANVRCFRPDRAQGNPFDYGLPSTRAVVDRVRHYVAEGYHVIVNETIDVHDGGVSGVSEGGVWEFAPDDTPRVVEKPGKFCTLPAALARALVSRVYDVQPPFSDSGNRRTEFSIHPHEVGHLQQRTLIWEEDQSTEQELTGEAIWPNPMSRHVGDKVFGLLIADAIGLPVPETTVISRRVPPFTFGRPTGLKGVWTRTAPNTLTPGKFTTVHGWADPFALLAKEDPRGDTIASVLVQRSVRAAYSGATVPTPGDGAPIIEGAAGTGDQFMLGTTPPEALPPSVIQDVAAVLETAKRAIGQVRIEWVHDGNRAWVVQMHRAKGVSSDTTLYPGTPENGWLKFRSGDDLDLLHELVTRAKAGRFGITVVGPVGLTSHVGDILRREEVPARISQQ